MGLFLTHVFSLARSHRWWCMSLSSSARRGSRCSFCSVSPSPQRSPPRFRSDVYGWASEREVCIMASIHSCTSVPMCARVHTRRRASRLATHICSCVSFADVSDTQQRSIILSTVQHLPTSCQQCNSIAQVLTALHRFSIADHYTCPSRCNGGCGGYWFHAAIHGRGHSRDAATRRCSGWGLNM